MFIIQHRCQFRPHMCQNVDTLSSIPILKLTCYFLKENEPYHKYHTPYYVAMPHHVVNILLYTHLHLDIDRMK